MARHALKKTPRAVLYAVGGVAILLLISAVVSELLSTGSIERVREATETVFAEVGLIVAAVAAAIPPVLALLNLTDDSTGSEGFDPEEDFDPEDVEDEELDADLVEDNPENA